ncbi:MAG: insulinase family protein [Oligoflexia bacterium]|nr:insulinase family protein [Oligoflexia bacterium]
MRSNLPLLVCLVLSLACAGLAGPAVARAGTQDAGGGCVALPSGDCQSSPVGLLAGGFAQRQLASGVRLVAVRAPTAGRVAVELQVLPAGGVLLEDRMIAWLLGSEEGGVAGAGRRQRRQLLGAAEALQVQDRAIRILVEGASTDLAELVSLEAGRLSDFAPMKADVQRAAGAVLALRRLELADPDRMLAELAWGRAAPVDSDADQDRDLAGRFATAWRGGAISVVVAGDLDPAVALDELVNAWRSWAQPAELPAQSAAPRPTVIPAVVPAVIPAVALPHDISVVDPPVVQTLRAEGVRRARVAVAWDPHTPRLDAKDEAAQALLRELLVGPGGLVWTRLVQQQGLVTRLWSPADAQGLLVMAELRCDAHPGAVLAAIETATAALIAADDPDLADQIERARLHLARAALLALDEPADWASAVASIMATGAGPQAVDARLDALRNVDVADLSRVAAVLLAPGQRREFEILPAPTQFSQP